MIIVIMGVAGSGKTTVGAMLAESLGCGFLDADALHPPGNIDRMSRGLPLTDADREPWLAAIRSRLLDAARREESLVVACSALRESYRRYLADGVPVIWVHLDGPEHLIRERLRGRTDHFFEPELLRSQIEALQPPADAIVANIELPPPAIVEHITSRLP